MASADAGAACAAALMPPPPAPSGALRGVVAHVLVRSETEGLNASAVFARRLSGLGAAVAERLGKGVTHVVFKGDADALRSLHDRVARLPQPRPAIVGVAWAAACAASTARAPEAEHLLPRPKDTLASLVSPHGRRAPAAAKQPRSMAPLPARRYEVDLEDPLFSSSQRMAAELASPGAGGTPVAPSSARGTKRRRSSGAAAAPSAPPVVPTTAYASLPPWLQLTSPLTVAPPSTKRARLGASGATPASAPRSAGGAAGGGGVSLSPLRPSNALARALRQAATARASPGERAAQAARGAADGDDDDVSPLRSLRERLPLLDGNAALSPLPLLLPPPSPAKPEAGVAAPGVAQERAEPPAQEQVAPAPLASPEPAAEAAVASPPPAPQPEARPEAPTEPAADDAADDVAAAPAAPAAVEAAATEASPPPPPAPQAAADDAACAIPAAPAACGPRRGVLAVTCASPELAAIAASAAAALPGLRLCPFAGAGVTHLVLGESGKRTLKVMHAIARGAWLLRPDWLHRSADAGAWLPEAEFADGAFPGAARARRELAAESPRRPLAGLRVLVAEPRRAAPPAAELRALLAALGAAPPRGGAKADFVIIAAAGPRPALPPAAAAATAVTEQWLFDAVAQYALPPDPAAYAPPPLR